MSISKELNNKFFQQYELAEGQRRLLIRSLYELIDDLENQPYLRYHKSFPFGVMDRGIQSVLDVIERKFIRRLWAYFRK